MKRIQKDIEIGKGKDITVLNSLAIDDEIVYEEREGDSLLYSFLYQMYAHVVGGAQHEEVWSQFRTSEPRGYASMRQPNGIIRAGTNDSFDNRDAWEPVTSVSGDPVTLGVGADLIHEVISNSEVLAIQVIGASGNTDLNGIHTDFTLNNTQTITLNQVSSTGTEDISNAYLAEIFKFWAAYRSHTRVIDHEPSLTRATLALGRNSDVNSIDTELLQDPIIEDRNNSAPGTLQYNAQTINAPAINLSQQISTIKMSREVQNNSGSDITAREIGILAGMRQGDIDGSNDHHGYIRSLIARDIINVTVSNGSTVSFSYSIRTKCELSGGIMTNFNEILYRLLALTTRSVNDINNQEQSAGVGFDRREDDNDAAYDQYRLYTSPKGVRGLNGRAGILVGSGTQDVDEANFDLNSRHPLGANSGELFPLGTAIQPMTLDTVNNEAFFEVTTMFENRSGGSIDVNELGLFVHTNGTGYGNPAMIMRHLTSQTETIANGETVEVTYRVSLSV